MIRPVTLAPNDPAVSAAAGSVDVSRSAIGARRARLGLPTPGVEHVRADTVVINGVTFGVAVPYVPTPSRPVDSDAPADADDPAEPPYLCRPPGRGPPITVVIAFVLLLFSASIRPRPSIRPCTDRVCRFRRSLYVNPVASLDETRPPLAGASRCRARGPPSFGPTSPGPNESKACEPQCFSIDARKPR